MTDSAVKLQDFARSMGVTDRAIQKHIQRHREDLEGHLERKGNNGTWLDDYAQSYIRDLMRPAPVVYAAGAVDELEDLRRELETVTAKYTAALEGLLAANQQIADNQAVTLLLEAATERLEAANDEISRLQSELQMVKAELDQADMAKQLADHNLAAANERIAALTQRTLVQRIFRRGE